MVERPPSKREVLSSILSEGYKLLDQIANVIISDVFSPVSSGCKSSVDRGDDVLNSN